MDDSIIGEDFTVEDIHRVRESNYERQKNMSSSERMADNERRVLEACSLFQLPLPSDTCTPEDKADCSALAKYGSNHREFQDLEDASQTSHAFWDNDTDDKVWNNE